jgi:hypothetical protein
MAKKRHKDDTKTFAELAFEEQAKSITAMLNNVQNAIRHHIDHAPNRQQTRQKCIDQTIRFSARVNRLP